ncbi:hypothetical protein LguiA_016126 [Lonicera macranthoides]
MERESDPNPNIHLPPGFRFHPSDEELIVHYLKNKATSNPLPASIIAEVELYKLDPWELPKKALFGGEEWYFFTPRERKYPNGLRPNRMAASGYWKATGTDKPIFSSYGAKIIGVKKALVFYKGRPPRGVKTDWIMDEYRLLETMVWTSKKKGSMRLDDWVLCRVRQKGSNVLSNVTEDHYSLRNEPVEHFPSMNTNPNNLEMLSDSLFKSCPMLPFITGSELNFPCMDTLSSISSESNRTTNLAFEDSLAGENWQVLVPSLNSMLKTPKRKHVERSQQESFIQPNKKLTNRDDLKEDVLSLRNDNIDMNFYPTYQPESNNLSAEWKPTVQYKELNYMAFA